MSTRVQFTASEKEYFLSEFERLKVSLSEFCRIYGIERTAITRWTIKYKNMGTSGLEEIKKNNQYTSSTMINAVKDYLENNFSMIYIVEKYNLSGDSVLRAWLKWYNTPKWNKKLGDYMAREKMTFENKLKWTLEFLNNMKKLDEIVKENNITPSQLRDWARKYKANGEAGLRDGRGRTKPLDSLSQEDILKNRAKELEKENNRLKAENLLLKKLKALMGGC